LSTRILAPVLSEFRRFYPDVYPQLLLAHEVLDVVAKEIDIALRLSEGPLPDSSLSARRLGDLPMGIYAAPAYLERHGSPSNPAELVNHACLLTQFYFDKPVHAWPLIRSMQSLSTNAPTMSTVH